MICGISCIPSPGIGSGNAYLPQSCDRGTAQHSTAHPVCLLPLGVVCISMWQQRGSDSDKTLAAGLLLPFTSVIDL